MERQQIAQLCERDVLEFAARLFGTTKTSLRKYEDYQGCANLVYEYECGGRPYMLRVLYRPDRSAEQVQAELALHQLSGCGWRAGVAANRLDDGEPA